MIAESKLLFYLSFLIKTKIQYVSEFALKGDTCNLSYSAEQGSPTYHL